ncbi:hypothetical protein GYMLUDRAFT_175341 [Collybiopsis luxurians FD-317 M1]|uniref:FAD-binding PCMH-type domain-containing protein n=1 Tax=Collybiopsis luxurians FD-317 M1 TaxID=944289 RepID=A0A0D0C025_9AGAR|nr:hypothetical protein GYMLUDRAFT_175341 [Collybiopsis luxurians FD-317 M1]
MVSKLANFLAQVFLLGFISSVRGVNDTSSSRCRCLYPDSSCWPSDADFASLASQVSQPLIYPVPPESACYPASNPSGNCAEVIANIFDGNWRSNQSGSMQSPNFETFIFPNGSISACFLNTSLGVPCQQGNVPPVGVDARTAEDIQAAVAFAEKWNLRVVVKSTGHDYLGRSSGRGSFMIWTHNMKNISYSASFIPEGGPSNVTFNALTLAAGVQWHEAYDAAQSNNRIVVGGIAPGGSVGAAGGWIQGGGHSILSPQFGLGVDNAIQFTVVTSSGSHLTANAYSHPDLFWALRGGGGGTYGVLTSVTYNTHPQESVILIAVEIANFTTPTQAQSIVSEFIRLSPSLSDLGWGGYAFISPQSFLFAGLAPNTSWADANATVKPFFDFVANATSGSAILDTIPFDTFYSVYTSLLSTNASGTDGIGSNNELASRLIPRDLVEKDYDRVSETLLSLNSSLLYHLVAGGAVSKVDPDSTGLNPAWRKAAAHVALGVSWPEGTSVSDIRLLEDIAKGYVGILEGLVGPDGGAYFNEASLYEPNFQETFFGDHYSKLQAIKDQYDPAGLFVVVEGVGSERWDDALECLKA